MKSDKLNKSESKYYNTACLMNEALICLLQKKEYSFITVKEICEKAGVNRSTFYLHYETMEDLLRESIEYIGKKVWAKYSKLDVINKNKIATSKLEDLVLVNEKYLLPYLEFVKENKLVYIAAYSQPNVLKTTEITKFLYDNVFEPILIRFNIPENERKYLITFCLNGMGAVIIEWIKNNCKDDIKDIATILTKCFKF